MNSHSYKSQINNKPTEFLINIRAVDRPCRARAELGRITLLCITYILHVVCFYEGDSTMNQCEKKGEACLSLNEDDTQEKYER